MYLVSNSRTNFNNHAKCITIGNIMNSKHNKATLRQRLIDEKNFWIVKLKTVYSQELNQEVSR